MSKNRRSTQVYLMEMIRDFRSARLQINALLWLNIVMSVPSNVLFVYCKPRRVWNFFQSVIRVENRKVRNHFFENHPHHVKKALTNIFLLKLSCEMPLHKGCFTGASIADQDELQEIRQWTLAQTGLERDCLKLHASAAGVSFNMRQGRGRKGGEKTKKQKNEKIKLTLNVTTGTDCAIDCAVVASYLSSTKQGGIVSTLSVISAQTGRYQHQASRVSSCYIPVSITTPRPRNSHPTQEADSSV